MKLAWLAAIVLAPSTIALGACDAGGEHHRRRDPGALVVAEAADVISLDPVRVTGTLTVPSISRWNAEWYGYVPADRKVRLNVEPSD